MRIHISLPSTHDNRERAWQHKIAAIKTVRLLTGLGLKDAKELVETCQDRAGTSHREVLDVYGEAHLDPDQRRLAIKSLIEYGFVVGDESVQLLNNLKELAQAAVDAEIYDLGADLFNVLHKHTG